MAKKHCKSCKAEIVWMVTDQNRPIPVNVESLDADTKYNISRGLTVRFDKNKGHEAHFATCPAVASFRKRKPKERVEFPPVPYKD